MAIIRYFKNGFCIGAGGEGWNCSEAGRRITFRIYLGKWIVTFDVKGPKFRKEDNGDGG